MFLTLDAVCNSRNGRRIHRILTTVREVVVSAAISMRRCELRRLTFLVELLAVEVVAVEGPLGARSLREAGLRVIAVSLSVIIDASEPSGSLSFRSRATPHRPAVLELSTAKGCSGTTI